MPTTFFFKAYSILQHEKIKFTTTENCALFLFLFLIPVTQYDCGATDGLGGNVHVLLGLNLIFDARSFVSGEQGCLQYYTGNTGEIASFNFPTQDAEIGPTSNVDNPF